MNKLKNEDIKKMVLQISTEIVAKNNIISHPPLNPNNSVDKIS